MSSQCFFPNGTQHFDSVIPCNVTAINNGRHSACCTTGDICLTNGLCRGGGDNDAGRNYYWRIGCTDPTGRDASCPQNCVDDGRAGNRSINIMVFNCISPDTKWACAPPGLNRNSDIMLSGCDDESLNFSAPAPKAYTTAIKAVTGRTTLSVLSTPTLLSTLTPSSASSTDSHTLSTPIQTTALSNTSIPGSVQASQTDSSSALKIGLGVGVPLGVLLLAAIGILIMLLRRRAGTSHGERQVAHYVQEVDGSDSRNMDDSMTSELYVPDDTKKMWYAVDAETPAGEVDGYHAPLEVEARHPAVELPVPVK